MTTLPPDHQGGKGHARWEKIRLIHRNKKFEEWENKILELGLGREYEGLACESFPNRIRKQKV